MGQSCLVFTKRHPKLLHPAFLSTHLSHRVTEKECCSLRRKSKCCSPLGFHKPITRFYLLILSIFQRSQDRELLPSASNKDTNVKNVYAYKPPCKSQMSVEKNNLPFLYVFFKFFSSRSLGMFTSGPGCTGSLPSQLLLQLSRQLM